MKKKFVSNEDESVRLFKNDFLEILTKVHPATPLVIFLPVVFWGICDQLPRGHAWSLFFFGLFFWTFFEYALHRFVFHWIPKNRVGQYLHFLFHGIHHDYPRDSRRLVMPPTVSILLSTTLYFIFSVVLSPQLTPGFFSGFISGYLCYDMIHFSLHHLNLRNSWFVALRNHHSKMTGRR
jgi:sterol desaturase/sphingolipid hydroxylase (fatty acid hydroxylase superfamily)